MSEDWLRLILITRNPVISRFPELVVCLLRIFPNNGLFSFLVSRDWCKFCLLEKYWCACQKAWLTLSVI